jgi:hypothetical protein
MLLVKTMSAPPMHWVRQLKRMQLAAGITLNENTTFTMAKEACV